ncbi:hypothetical protein A3860_14750 [Niastella vici]|uniref:Apea-like HEPN domain-containing protein n=1 Tax=Niastella vici TaxID=1703345 RepID=A0A1V9G5K3_9BACT|nr:hypothetical protein [Niastella vici]OQP65850.1 hypothetical protein A3860_14750 [Niastella vici]
MSQATSFLIQQEPRLSTKEAEKIIDNILKKLGIKLQSKGKQKEFIIKNQGTEKEEKRRYFELVKDVRTLGICKFIQDPIDQNDLIFGGTLGLSTPNWQLSIVTEWAGYKKSLNGPCRSVPSEIEFSEDIEFYKEETCIESSNHDFVMCARNYRGYLLSTIALIDSYINRHILFHAFKGRNTTNFHLLKESRNTEERIELFIDEFCSFPFSEVKQNLMWDHFKKLKALRNEAVHSLSPYLGIELKEIAFNLNLSIHGVGSLLKKLQEGQGRISLGFIERVRTSPTIHYNQITLRADGNHLEEKFFNKVNRG